MDRLQRNGGTAGIVAAIALAIAFGLFLTSGLDPQTASDPSKALSIVTQQGARWTVMGLGFSLATGLAVLLLAALAALLRDKAPTRARALLYLGIIGLAGHGLASFATWQGGAQLAQYAAKDQVAAGHAWIALGSLITAFDGLGNGFTGAAMLLAGWAITSTSAMSTALGWVGIVAGALGLLSALGVASPVVFLGNIVLTVVWLAWTGSALRKV